MSNIESPAGASGGPVTVPALDDLPERMRVHALARRLARTSREVLAAVNRGEPLVRAYSGHPNSKALTAFARSLVPAASGGDSPGRRSSGTRIRLRKA